jgi:hypothetical protein
VSMFSSGYPKRASTLGPGTRYKNRLFAKTAPKPQAPAMPPALVPYRPGFEMPAPMEALQDLSMAIGGRRRRSRLSISGIGGM